jgi:CubicO group peptidase (beta-lactamase class C family)
MRKALVLLAGICVLLGAVARHSSSGTMAALAEPGREAPGTLQEPAGTSDVNARVARIENGLLPPVIIQGQPVAAMSISDRMKHYNVPGVSIAFFGEGRILWTRTYGFADVAGKKPVTTETLFQAASISKPVSALAALKLVQEGKLSLDEDVNVKLRTWKVPENEFTKDQKVTLRRILSHSAGLTVHGFPGYASDEPVPTIVQILNGEKPANTPPIRVDTVPGTIWRYSGGGYVVMQALLMDVTGMPYPQIVHDLVLVPAGMTHSTYQQPLPGNLAPMAATPYRGDGQPVKGGWHTYPEMAPAGLWTTPSDLALLAIEVQKEYAGKSSKILSQATMREMLTRQKDNWGLGFGLEDPGRPASFGHGGANEGFQCNLQAFTEAASGEGLAIMTNSDRGGQLAGEVLRAVAREYNWPDFQPGERKVVAVDPKVFDGYVGRYQLGPDFILTFTREGNHFFTQATRQPKDEIFASSDRDFFLTAVDAQVTFVTDSNGRATEVIVHQGGQDHHAKRIE